MGLSERFHALEKASVAGRVGAPVPAVHQLQHREILVRLVPHQLGVVRLAVAHGHLGSLSVLDHVEVGHQVALLVPDESAAAPLGDVEDVHAEAAALNLHRGGDVDHGPRATLEQLHGVALLRHQLLRRVCRRDCARVVRRVRRPLRQGDRAHLRQQRVEPVASASGHRRQRLAQPRRELRFLDAVPKVHLGFAQQVLQLAHRELRDAHGEAVGVGGDGPSERDRGGRGESRSEHRASPGERGARRGQTRARWAFWDGTRGSGRNATPWRNDSRRPRVRGTWRVPAGGAVGPGALVLATERGVYERVARARVQPPRSRGMRRAELPRERSASLAVSSTKRGILPREERRGVGAESVRGGARTQPRGDVARESSRRGAHVGKLFPFRGRAPEECGEGWVPTATKASEETVVVVRSERL